MEDNIHSEVVHLKVDDHLPAIPSSVPAAEVLKQILEQILENERQRVRNEFIRISSVFLVLLLLILGGGFWAARNILIQIKEARLISQHSQDALLELLSAHSRKVPSHLKTAEGTKAELLTRREDRNAALEENPVEIQKIIADLEGKNKALSELMQTQNANIKSLLLDVLKARDTEIQDLRVRIDAKQTHLINAESVEPELPPAPPQGKPQEQQAPVPATAHVPDQLLIKSLTVPVANDMPLRLPIPSP